MFIESALYAVGGIKFNDNIETARISNIGIEVNPDFWKVLNDVERDFLIEHELYHLIFEHLTHFKQITQEINQAMDAAINSILQYKYVGDGEPDVVIPTLYRCGVFPSKYGLPELQTTIYYLEAFKSIQSNIVNSWIDDIQLSKEEAEKLLEQIKQSIGEQSMPGRGVGELSEVIRKHIERPAKTKFNDAIKEIAGNTTNYHGFGMVDRYQTNRNNINLIPYERLREGNIRARKQRLLVILDYSGSCKNMVELFEAAAASISPNFFDIRKFIFASDAAEVSLGNNDYNSYKIGGGTSFSKLVRYILDKGIIYDQAWIFTDGDGDNISDYNIEYSKWTWLLSSYSRTEYIPPKSKIRFLSEFVYE